MTVEDSRIPSEKIPCRSCGTPMPAGFPLCKECGSHQGLKRFFSVSTPVLGLLVALVSVVGVNISQVVQALNPPRAALNVGARFLETGEIDLTINNAGRASGNINPIMDCSQSEDHLQFSADAPILVRSNETQIARLRPISTFFISYQDALRKSAGSPFEDKELEIPAEWICKISGSDGQGALGDVSFFNSTLNLHLAKHDRGVAMRGYFSPAQ